MTRPARYNVLGVGVHALTLEGARDLLIGAAKAGPPGYVCCCDVNSVSHARRNAFHREILNRAFLNTPDGMPLVWLGHRHGHPEVTRVYGPDLLLATCAATAGTPVRHFFCGSRPGVAAELAGRMSNRFPGLNVAGSLAPPFGLPAPELATALAGPLREAEPDLIWIGLGTPLQESVMARLNLGRGIQIGIGAAFDFLTDRVPQAPRTIQRSGLEWPWRLAHEPRRLAPRYLRNNPLFVLRIFAQLTGMKRYPIED